MTEINECLNRRKWKLIFHKIPTIYTIADAEQDITKILQIRRFSFRLVIDVTVFNILHGKQSL